MFKQDSYLLAKLTKEEESTLKVFFLIGWIITVIGMGYFFELLLKSIK